MAFMQEMPALAFPQDLGLHATVNAENAVQMLLRAIQLSQTTPYSYTYIDKPQEGKLMLLYVAQNTAFPNDGIRFQEQETRGLIPAGQGRELEICEIKFGFFPGPGSPDTQAWRVRRRFRLQKGGHPNLVLVHWSRGPTAPIMIPNQPVRNYPLPPINQPSVFILGDKMGHKVLPNGMAIPPNAPAGAPLPQFNNQQQMLNQSNNMLEQLERRKAQEREKAAAAAAVAQAAAANRTADQTKQRPPKVEDGDSDDDTEHIYTRTIASTRFRRNHEFMNDVFQYAAFGEKTLPPTPPTLKSIFNKDDLEAKIAKLNQELELLKNRNIRDRTSENDMAITV